MLTVRALNPAPKLLLQVLLLLKPDVSVAGRGPEPVNTYQQAFYQYQTIYCCLLVPTDHT